jgi:hypothetical protein
MSVKGLGSPAGKEPKSESLFFNRRSHQGFSSADGKRNSVVMDDHKSLISFVDE